MKHSEKRMGEECGLPTLPGLPYRRGHGQGRAPWTPCSGWRRCPVWRWIRRTRLSLNWARHRRHLSFRRRALSRVPTVTECAKLPNLMALLFIDGRLMPAKISQRGPLQDAQELYSYVSRRCEAKAVFVFDRCPSLGARDHQARLHERGSSADG
jgi:hypothetical protein